MEEAEDLDHAAEWRMRKVDTDPSDTVSSGAAVLLTRLAEEVRRLQGSEVFREYTAICHWLSESGEVVDFMDMANDYRAQIGVDRFPQDGAAYLRALIDLAKQTFGAT